jgi:hypothetical protein
MKALYDILALAENMPKVIETPPGGVGGQVDLPWSSRRTGDPAARISPPPPPPNQGQMGAAAPLQQAPGGYQATGGVHIVGGYKNAVSFRFHEGVTYKSIRFEPWLKANTLGPKAWIARTLPDNEKIVVKLWDAWTCSADDQEREASVYYLKLRPLWGKWVPPLRVQSPLEFYHALIIQYIEVCSRHCISLKRR